MNKIYKLFSELHKSPELSFNEKNTIQILKHFLQENTTLKIVSEKEYFYAVHYESAEYESIAFRADIDAIKSTDGTPFHGCGHDGHMATICKIALNIEGKHIGKNIYFIFQPAEENGMGAKIIAPMLQNLGISHIYGFHNIPGFDEGLILLKAGTFACTSKGLTISFYGTQSHAAYPESGKNPAFAIAEVISKINEILSDSCFKKLVLATIVNVSVGEKDSFGVNAGSGSLSLTIRAELESDISLLEQTILNAAETACKNYSIMCTSQSFDVFPETTNCQAEFEAAKQKLTANNIKFAELTQPMRWSEDFGHYLKVCSGMFIGIGAGVCHPDLHTPSYSYNTNIIEYSANVLMLLGGIL